MPASDTALRQMAQQVQTAVANALPPAQAAPGKLLLAFSSGADSVVLAHLLLHTNFADAVALAHVHYGLRGADALADAAFAKDFAAENTFQLHYYNAADALKESISSGENLQQAARKLRYNWLEQLQQQHNFALVLTAHHATDQAETVIQHLVRGSGLQGLAGMRSYSELNGLRLLRPLLPYTKQQLLQLAQQQQLSWREDESNADTKYQRNRIRHQLVPQLEQLNPQAVKHIATTARYVQELQAWAVPLVQQQLLLLCTNSAGGNILKFTC